MTRGELGNNSSASTSVRMQQTDEGIFLGRSRPCAVRVTDDPSPIKTTYSRVETVRLKQPKDDVTVSTLGSNYSCWCCELGNQSI